MRRLSGCIGSSRYSTSASASASSACRITQVLPFFSVMGNLDKEVPHGTAIEVTKFSERDSGVIDLDVTIYCEKASHKGIIIGKNGATLKKIASHAREDIERFMRWE